MYLNLVLDFSFIINKCIIFTMYSCFADVLYMYIFNIFVNDFELLIVSYKFKYIFYICFIVILYYSICYFSI